MASSSSSFAIRKSNSIIQAGEKPHQKKKSNKPAAAIPPRTYMLCETRVVQAPVPKKDVVESSPERKASLCGGSVAEKLNDHNNFRFGGVAYHRTGQPTTAPSSNNGISGTAFSIQSRSSSFTGKENHTKLVREQQSVPLQCRAPTQKFPTGRDHERLSSSSSSSSGTVSHQKTTVTSSSSSSSHPPLFHRNLSKPSVAPQTSAAAAAALSNQPSSSSGSLSAIVANRTNKLRTSAATATIPRATSTATSTSVGYHVHSSVQLCPSSLDTATSGVVDGNPNAPSSSSALSGGPPMLSDLFTRMGKTSFVPAPHTGTNSNINRNSNSSVIHPVTQPSEPVTMGILSGVFPSDTSADLAAASFTVPAMTMSSTSLHHGSENALRRSATSHMSLSEGSSQPYAMTTGATVVNNDNFVRQNLKNRGGACRGARPKSAMAARHARIKDLQNRRLKSKQDERVTFDGQPHCLANVVDNTEEGGYEVPSDYNNGTTTVQDFDKNHHHPSSHSAGNAMHAQTDTVCSASSRYGLDPLQLSLDAIEGVAPAVLATDATKNMTKSSSSSCTTHGISTASSTTAISVVVANKSNVDTLTTKHLRVKKGSRHRHSGRYGGFDDVVLEAEDVRPACSGHQLPAKLITVRKDGANKGRKFYGCAYPADQRCKFFMWAEDNPQLIALVLEERANAQERDRALGPEEAYRAAAVRSYCERLDQMSVPELKDEIRRCLRRRQLADTDVKSSTSLPFKLTVGGSRTHLLALLEKEAVRVMKFGGVLMGGSSQPVALTAYDHDHNQDHNHEHDQEHGSKTDEGDGMLVLSSSDSEHGDNNSSDDEDEDNEDEDEDEDNEDEDNEVDHEHADQDQRNHDNDGGESDNNDDDDQALWEAAGGSLKVRRRAGKSSGGRRSKRARTRVSINDDDDFHEDEDNDDDDDDESEKMHSRGRKRASSHRQSVHHPLPPPAAKDELEATLRNCFGHVSFRCGQRWATERALQGFSSLLVMPTGAGKSLCYMLPAAMLPGLTVVVSPLIALMQDQMKRLPVSLPGACFSGGMSTHQASNLCAAVLDGHVKVLYVSPERLCTQSFRQLIRALRNRSSHGTDRDRDRFAVSLVCVDEAHCLSQWSYNFRPAFLRIRREIDFIQPRATLALTATASPMVQRDIMANLHIHTLEGAPAGSPQDGLLAMSSRRENLGYEAVVVDAADTNANDGSWEQRCKAILDLLTASSATSSSSSSSRTKHKRGDLPGGSKRSAKSVSVLPLTIVYVWRRDEAESLAGYLRASGMLSGSVVSYHAGMDTDQRAKAQQLFDRGTARVVVATVAFGLGVDKADVRRVVHSSLPKSVENYVQETGRAGRDGLPATCHLIVSRQDAEQQMSLAHANRLCQLQVAAMLLEVFVVPQKQPQKTVHQNSNSTLSSLRPLGLLYEVVAVSVDRLQASCDVAGAVVETVLSILELPSFGLVELEGTHLNLLSVKLRYANLQVLHKAAEAEPVLAALLRLRTTAAVTAKAPATGASAVADADDALVSMYDVGSHGACAALDGPPGANGRLPNHRPYLAHAAASSASSSSSSSSAPPLHEFQLSLLDLVLECNSSSNALAGNELHSRESTVRSLFALQRRGLLEYSLAGPAIYLTVHTSIVVHQCQQLQYSSLSSSAAVTGAGIDQEAGLPLSSLGAWLWQLAGRVASTLSDIDRASARRTEDMWRIGSTIAAAVTSSPAPPSSCVARSSCDRPSDLLDAFDCDGDMDSDMIIEGVDEDPPNVSSTATTQPGIRAFLAHYMEHLSSRPPEAASLIAGAVVDDIEAVYGESDEALVCRRMIEAFHAVPRPIHSLALPDQQQQLLPDEDVKPEKQALERDLKRLASDVDMLARDQRLQSVVRTVAGPTLRTLRRCTMRTTSNINVDSESSSTTNATDETLTTATWIGAEKEILALYITRVLHGLATKAVPASAWKDNGAICWGQYKRFEFDSLLNMVLFQLNTMRD